MNRDERRALQMSAFARHPLQPIQESETKVTITEQRAPTDESVRLLKEMQEAAEQRIIDSLRLENNNFSGVLQTYEDWASDQIVLSLTFELNGVKIKEEERVHKGHVTAAEALGRLRDRVGQRIASDILRLTFDGSEECLTALARLKG